MCNYLPHPTTVAASRSKYAPIFFLLSNKLSSSSKSQRSQGSSSKFMAIIGDALRQAFMPKQEYESLREEDRAWTKLQRPLVLSSVAFLCSVVFTCNIVSLNIVFPPPSSSRPFCSDGKVEPLNVYGSGSFDLTDQETVAFYWMVVFLPSMMLFLVSSVYLVAGEFQSLAFVSFPHMLDLNMEHL